MIGHVFSKRSNAERSVVMVTYASKPKCCPAAKSLSSPVGYRFRSGRGRGSVSVPESHIYQSDGGDISEDSSVRVFESSGDGGSFSLSKEVAPNFRLIKVETGSNIFWRPKFQIGRPGDAFEREADRVESIFRQPLRAGAWQGGEGISMKNAPDDSSALVRPDMSVSLQQVEPTRSSGSVLDERVKREVGYRMGFDFGNVRVHTDESAVFMNKRLRSRAFTYGSDIYFNRGEYRPDSLEGRSLLAHELTHVVQQSCAGGGGMQRKMVQCTTVGEVLDNFFSPFSYERLWVMRESDNYTGIVRRWQPVIDAVRQVKAHLEANCTMWSRNHTTDPSWRPGMTDPPVTDPRAHGIWISSPPGTDPGTCRNAFIIYVTSKVAGSLPFPVVPVPEIQTFELYTCSIGSFGIYATVDTIDCTAKSARINIWMYNAMDRESFGRFADHPAFSLSGMERQYMWWNWKENHRWGTAAVQSGTTGGSGGW